MKKEKRYYKYISICLIVILALALSVTLYSNHQQAAREEAAFMAQFYSALCDVESQAALLSSGEFEDFETQELVLTLRFSLQRMDDLLTGGTRYVSGRIPGAAAIWFTEASASLNGCDARSAECIALLESLAADLSSLRQALSSGDGTALDEALSIEEFSAVIDEFYAAQKENN